MITISFGRDKSRAAAYDGDYLVGECDVIMQRAFWIITHTEVDPAYGGQGIAGKLVACVVEAARKADVKIKPFCSYAARQFATKPEYAGMEDHSVIVVFGMKTCPDCRYVDEQIRFNKNFKIVDIGDHVKNLKAFLRLRDTNPAFDEVKKSGGIGIPCFVMEDGSLTLKPEEVGLKSRPQEGAACRLDK